jgi:hypothetical protein
MPSATSSTALSWKCEHPDHAKGIPWGEAGDARIDALGLSQQYPHYESGQWNSSRSPRLTSPALPNRFWPNALLMSDDQGAVKMGQKRAPGSRSKTAKMWVGTRRLELLTPTVSKPNYQVIQQLTGYPGLPKSLLVRQGQERNWCGTACYSIAVCPPMPPVAHGRCHSANRTTARRHWGWRCVCKCHRDNGDFSPFAPVRAG